MFGFGKKKKEEKEEVQKMEKPEITDRMVMEKDILVVLKNIFDPEIPVNIFDLGLVYEIDIKEDFHVDIIMTLTAPNCPVAESLPQEVKDKVAQVNGVKSAEVEIVFDPPWDKEMMSEEAKLDLGFL
jgi:FeS assembly SUF system protein